MPGRCPLYIEFSLMCPCQVLLRMHNTQDQKGERGESHRPWRGIPAGATASTGSDGFWWLCVAHHGDKGHRDPTCRSRRVSPNQGQCSACPYLENGLELGLLDQR